MTSEIANMNTDAFGTPKQASSPASIDGLTESNDGDSEQESLTLDAASSANQLQDSSTTTTSSSSSSKPNSQSIKPTPLTTIIQQVRGKPVSGRVWKPIAQKNSNALAPVLKKSWNKRMQERKEREVLIKMKKELEQEKLQKKEAAKQAKLERQKRKEENELKAEISQKISAAKLKRMNKKQYKNLKKQQ